MLRESDSIAITDAGGSGTEGNPYIISTAAHLIELSDTMKNPDKNYSGYYFKQTANIVFDNNKDNGLTAIGTQYSTNMFKGSFDGGP